MVDKSECNSNSSRNILREINCINLGEYIPEREESATVVGKIKTRTKIAIIFFAFHLNVGKEKTT